MRIASLIPSGINDNGDLRASDLSGMSGSKGQGADVRESFIFKMYIWPIE